MGLMELLGFIWDLFGIYGIKNEDADFMFPPHSGKEAESVVRNNYSNFSEKS